MLEGTARDSNAPDYQPSWPGFIWRDSRESADSGPAGRPPRGVKAIRNLEFARTSGSKLLLDLYVPAASAGPLPVIAWVHGGGWRSGDKEPCPAVPMAAKGYAVASISYRLSGEAVFPAQIEDCKAAIRWLRANASTYKLDPDRIGAWGSSAGGHLVALLGTAVNTKEFDTGENLAFSSRVQAVCDFYGPTDFLQMDAHATPGSAVLHGLPMSPESLLIGGPIQENRDKVVEANPITYVASDSAPFLIVHGDEDRRVPLHQSRLLYDALKRAGVEAELVVVKGGGHGGPQFRKPDIRGKVEAFFDKQLKPAA